MNSNGSLLSIIIPVFNEAENIEWHHKQIANFLKNHDIHYELIYINDGSKDDSLSILKNIKKQSGGVRLLSFSRNFGKEAATTAGLNVCHGDAAVMMDADGQHPVELINEFLARWREGYQVVIGVRKDNTGEGFIKRYGSKLFYKLLSSITRGETIPNSTDFRLLDRQVINEFNKLTERNRITRGLIDWLGFRRTTVEFTAPSRHGGNPTYGIRKLVALALHAFVSQSTKPLQLGGILGTFTVLSSAIVTVFLVVEKLAGDPLDLAVTGTAILALFISFLIGIVLVCQWLLAIYIESIHNETQNRPLYIVDEES